MRLLSTHFSGEKKTKNKKNPKKTNTEFLYTLYSAFPNDNISYKCNDQN